jgi:hypothetical protein
VLVPDPDRPLRAIRRELEEQGRVTLIGKTGPPRWYRGYLDSAGLGSPVPDRAFFFDALRFSLLELLPDLPDVGFRLRAEVFQYSGGPRSSAGLYFAHRSHPRAEGPEHEFIMLAFNEFGPITVNGPDGTPLYRELRPRLFRICEPIGTAGYQLPVQQRYVPWNKTLATESLAEHSWRRLAVEVLPQQVRFFWDEVCFGQLSLAELQNCRARMLLAVSPLNPEPVFTTSGGVGLVVQEGTAAFRNVTLEKIDN